MKVLQYFLKDDGIFPNSDLPVLLYKRAIALPFLFREHIVKSLLRKHHWTNNWKSGVYTYHHYHSNTHEVMAVIKGKTQIQLGGENGTTISVEKGDVLLIPAGVAHKNLQEENDVICIGGYPRGTEYDMNYGKKEERPAADKRIAKVPMPGFDPVTGKKDPIHKIWNKYGKAILSK
jgi:uncharacterized protein YjlB